METKPPFEVLARRHGATILRVCRAVLTPADAQDAWSETFLSALTAYDRLPVGANHEAWLVTIAHRKTIDLTRAARRRAIPVADLPERDSELRADHRDLDLWAALRSLPDKQRRVVALHHLGGLPYQEVAELLGGTSEAARRAGSDGIAALRRALGQAPVGETLPAIDDHATTGARR